MGGLLRPGAKLKIEEVRASYALGASPIREALSLLTSDGFVERLDQRGFRVAPISIDDFADLLKARLMVEEAALRESIRLGDRLWEEEIVLATYRLERPNQWQDADRRIASAEWERQHKAFHLSLLAACRSTYILEFCARLYDQNVRYRRVSGTGAYPERDVQAEHHAIRDAVLDRNADLSAELLSAHYTRTGDYLIETMIS